MAYLRSSIGRITTSSFASDPVPFVAGLTAVASGAIVGGKGVVINSDGTVSEATGAPASTALSVQDEDTLKVFENADSQYDQNCKSAIDPNNKNNAKNLIIYFSFMSFLLLKDLTIERDIFLGRNFALINLGEFFSINTYF